MQKPIDFPDHIPMDPMALCGWMMFLQLMTNRRVMGALRYAQKPKRSARYLSRLKKEVEAYEADGNMEHLLNVGVYCWLESEAPENEMFHFDNTVDSVTRSHFGECFRER